MTSPDDATEQVTPDDATERVAEVLQDTELHVGVRLSPIAKRILAAIDYEGDQATIAALTAERDQATRSRQRWLNRAEQLTDELDDAEAQVATLTQSRDTWMAAYDEMRDQLEAQVATLTEALRRVMDETGTSTLAHHAARDALAALSEGGGE